MQFRRLGLVDFPPTFEAMKVFTAARTGATDDEIWLLQHPPVYTQGLSGQAEHVLDAGAIPVVHIDRGGQVTYHGPGQLIAYVLYDLRRAGMNVRELVESLERAVINLLADHGVTAQGDPAARGVYVRGKKIAALGLKVSRGRSYHGLSLNVDMDLSPFAGINPCGHKGLEVTSVQQELESDQPINFSDIGERLLHHLGQVLPSQT
jgi:lipoyl(octanoyl) transferase